LGKTTLDGIWLFTPLDGCREHVPASGCGYFTVAIHHILIQSKEKRLFRIKSKVPAHKEIPPQPQQLLCFIIKKIWPARYSLYEERLLLNIPGAFKFLAALDSEPNFPIDAQYQNYFIRIEFK
jgi:hypothetical protein